MGHVLSTLFRGSKSEITKGVLVLQREMFATAIPGLSGWEPFSRGTVVTGERRERPSGLTLKYSICFSCCSLPDLFALWSTTISGCRRGEGGWRESQPSRPQHAGLSLQHAGPQVGRGWENLGREYRTCRSSWIGLIRKPKPGGL